MALVWHAGNRPWVTAIQVLEAWLMPAHMWLAQSAVLASIVAAVWPAKMASVFHALTGISQASTTLAMAVLLMHVRLSLVASASLVSTEKAA